MTFPEAHPDYMLDNEDYITWLESYRIEPELPSYRVPEETMKCFDEDDLPF